jgi:hypothetical protein
MVEIPYDLQKGSGSLKHYTYWTGGIILRTKASVLEGISLKLRIMRTDKITKKVEKFDYKTKRFEVPR